MLPSNKHEISLQCCWLTETKGDVSVFMQRCYVHMQFSSSASSKSQHCPQLHYASIKWMDFTHGDDVAFNLFSSMDYPINQLFLFFKCSVNEAPTEGYVCNAALLPISICGELLEFPYKAMHITLLCNPLHLFDDRTGYFTKSVCTLAWWKLMKNCIPVLKVIYSHATGSVRLWYSTALRMLTLAC